MSGARCIVHSALYYEMATYSNSTMPMEEGEAVEICSAVVKEVVNIVSSEGEDVGGGGAGGSGAVVRGGGGVRIVRCVGRRRGFEPEPGKFVERKFDKLGRAKGKYVCELCHGICCGTVRDIIFYFLKRRIISKKPEVGFKCYECLFDWV